MKKRKKIACIILIMAVLCGCLMPFTVQASGKLKISRKKVTLYVGKSTTLKVTGGKKVKWSSSRKSVVSVNKKGKITAKAKGTAIITAKCGGRKVTCKVTVKNRTKAAMTDNGSNPGLRNLSGKIMRLKLGNGKSYTVALYDNSAANDLWNRLPLSYTISNYSGWDEKLIRMGNDQELSMTDYTGGDNPNIPEVGYYQPGNWIALYYGYIGYWSGKIPVGQINATCEEIQAIPVGTTVTLEKA